MPLMRKEMPGDFERVVAWTPPAPHPPDGYLDAVAGQPLLPASQQAVIAAFGQSWSDPARLHHQGRRAGLVLDASRTAIAAFLGVPAAQCLLGSSAADLMHAVVSGLFAARTRAGAAPRILISAAESMAVRFAAQACSGAELIDVPVDDLGRVDVAELAVQLEQGAALVCVQRANAEVGTMQPSAQVHALCSAHDVPLVSEAAQVAGHTDVGSDWDALVVSPRDWAGPSGVGVLAVAPGVRWRPPEAPDRGWVGGFPEIPAAAGAGAAAEYLDPFWRAQADIHRRQTAKIRSAIDEIPGAHAIGDPNDRLPHIVTFIVDDVIGERLVTELDRRGYAAASGSACTADTRMPSHVVAAMGISTNASVRIGLPYGCTEATVEGFVTELPDAIAQARL